MIGNCFKATQKKDNTRAPRAMEGESNISRLHNIFSASHIQHEKYYMFVHSSSSHVSFKDFFFVWLKSNDQHQLQVEISEISCLVVWL